MIRGLISIQLVFSIFLSSIGFRVMHHHCIWCGGNRIEMVVAGVFEQVSSPCCKSDEETCCRNTDATHHSGCCAEELLKINQALASNDVINIKKPASLDLSKFMAAAAMVTTSSPQSKNLGCQPSSTQPPPWQDDPVTRFLSIRC